MGFRKRFLWAVLQQPINARVVGDEGGRGLANVDVVPIGEDRFSVITGKRKCLNLIKIIFIQQKLAIDMYHHYKEDIALFAEMGFKTYRMSIA